MIRLVKKPDIRRQEIVSASRALFLSQGYDHTTMQDIITKLQIAKGTIYHYFKAKEELLDAVVEDMVSEYVAGIEKALKGQQGNALDKMRVLITAGQIADTQKDTLDKLHASGNRRLHAHLLAVTISKLAPFYARIITQGCEEGLFRVEHPLECAEMLLAGIQFVTDIGFYPWTKGDLKRRFQAIPALFENQLNAPKNTFNFLTNEF